ncbi:hypothetical protein IQ228_07935 [Dolichospermum sp. LEGE 00246]|jgi:hypothetical protein|nr:hypothetical protein [Dolichospermum sp. LEGE 00246]MBE9257285.1 hypothetical protein [Dolichospermum sp. LEGE 00246]
MSIAKGQDSQAEDLLYNPPNSVKIFIPNICYIEAVSVYKLEKQEKLKFKRELELKITEIDRDKTSNYAPLLSQQLQETIITNNALRNTGIKYFAITQDFLNWFNSRSST